MKKIIVVIGLIVCIVLGLYAGTSLHQYAQNPSPQSKKVVEGVNTTFTPTVTTSSTGIPIRITIPKLRLDATVEPVGTDTQGRMDVPKHVQDVGWYMMGTKPGEKGSAVIDGHLDTVTGAPAVFYYVSKLQARDTIIITDDKNTSRTFIVTSNISYPYDKVPLGQVFNTADKPRLNLITCQGTWDKATKNYSNREVIYAEMQ